MKTAIITGASSGIGKAIAQEFANKNWRPLLVARNKEKLEALSEELSGCPYFVCDLSQPQEIEKLAQDILSQHSKIDALINNAGIYRPSSLDEDNDNTWDEQFQTNLMGPVRLTRGLWSSLKANKASVVNISSTLGIRPIPNTAAYSALKGALNNWTLSIAIEGAAFGLRANAVCPGIVDTPIHSFIDSNKPEDQEIYQQVQHLQPLKRTGKPQEIAPLVYHLASEESAWTTGAIINVDGGILLNS